MYIIYLYTLGNVDKHSLLLRCHTTVMLMYVVDHPVAQPWWQLIHYNILSGKELVYAYTARLEKLHNVS